MPEIKYSDNPNEETAFVETDGGQRNRAVLTAAVDGEIEFPANPNSTKVSVTVDGVKRKAIAVATIAGGGGDQHNLGYYATQAALEEAHPTAEAGDWAIVGATDTVWLWDSDNSEWVDSDQKGQVTSVNGQTGDVTLTIPEAVQYDTMPTASADNLGDIVQFTGTTDANYTNGYFYKCSQGTSSATASQTTGSGLSDVAVVVATFETQATDSGSYVFTYSAVDSAWIHDYLITDLADWGITYTGTPVDADVITVVYDNGLGWAQVDVQPSSSSSYTAGTGIDITNDVISVTAPTLVNNATSGVSRLAVGDGATAEQNTAQAFGVNSHAKSNGSLAVGYGVQAQGNYSTAISGATSAVRAIQLGYDGLNSDANTFKVANANGNYEIMSADGTVPTARLTKVNTTATLAVADWSSNTQTVSVTGVAADSVVFVSPAPASASDYASAGILCTAQAAGTLTFTCDTVPSNAITVNVICF